MYAVETSNEVVDILEAAVTKYEFYGKGIIYFDILDGAGPTLRLHKSELFNSDVTRYKVQMFWKLSQKCHVSKREVSGFFRFSFFSFFEQI